MLLPGAFAASVITTRLEDPKAIYVDAPATTADSSAALQAAIDKASGTGREGIVFIPMGRYTLTRTVYLWPGVRLIGYGATRPVFVLPPNTPGFQKGMGVMVMFTGLTLRSDRGPEIALRFLHRDRCRQTTTWPMPIRIRSIRR